MKIPSSRYLFRIIVFVCFSLLITGCASRSISISKASNERRNSLTFFSQYYEGLSLNTYNYLSAHDLLELYKSKPKATIILLNTSLKQNPNHRLMEVLANACFLCAQNERRLENAVPYYIDTAKFCYLYLTTPDNSNATTYYDTSRFLITHYYNYSIKQLFDYLKNQNLLFNNSYPITSITGEQILFESPNFNMPYPASYFKDFLPCSDYEIDNLDFFAYRPGVGVPLIACLKRQEHNNQTQVYEAFDQSIPCTISLHFHLNSQGQSKAHFVFHNPYQEETLLLDDKPFPLEYDFSTPLAHHMISEKKFSNIFYTLYPMRTKDFQGLYLLEPYDSQKIPVIFVHGILSDPSTWVQMLNTMRNDSELRKHYQFWLFTYSAGYPVIYSAHMLRQAIQQCYDKYHGTQKQNDQNFRNMVLVGHSMGGLVSKMQILNSGDELYYQFFDRKTIDPIVADLDEPKYQTFNQIYQFCESPYVQRVIYLATPHRGSQIASFSIVRWLRTFIKFSADVVEKTPQMLGLSEDEISRYTGIADLDPENKTLEIIQQLKRKPIPFHSIIGNTKRAVIGGNDGIVPYSSSHLDDAVSEYIVKSGHSVQVNPLTIQEVCRILHEHLKQTATDSSKETPENESNHP